MLDSTRESLNDLQSQIRPHGLEITYKDVTLETLNEDGFIEAVEKAFPEMNWRVPYKEFKAAGEQDGK